MWACPHCQQALQPTPDETSWVCSNKHQFDRAREGYVNLLPSNRKRSREPGDSPEMIAARHRVHSQQVYHPLARALQEQTAPLTDITSMLDLGCGEGYYCEALVQAQPKAQLFGVDISKAAVRKAARGHRAASFAVASSFQLPVLDNSLSLVARIFAPSDDAEVMRVLQAHGYYLEITPAPTHLWELRENLYGKPVEHAASRGAIDGMHLLNSVECEYKMELATGLLRDVINMTPYAYRGHREKRAALLRRDGLTLSMAFSLNLFQLQ